MKDYHVFYTNLLQRPAGLVACSAGFWRGFWCVCGGCFQFLFGLLLSLCIICSVKSPYSFMGMHAKIPFACKRLI